MQENVYSAQTRPLQCTSRWLGEYIHFICTISPRTILNSLAQYNYQRWAEGHWKGAKDYTSYESALKKCGLVSLKVRRTQLYLNFARKCLKHEHMQNMFPVNTSDNATRSRDKFKVTFAYTDRLKNSAIPYMQRLLNAFEKQKKAKKSP